MNQDNQMNPHTFEDLYKLMARFTASNGRRDYYTGKPFICHCNRDAFYNLMENQKDIAEIRKILNQTSN